MTSEEKGKMRVFIMHVLDQYERRLSDGYNFYSPDVTATLGEIADKIIENIP